MGLPEELYHAMMGAGWQAKRNKIPGPLVRTMIDVAQKSLELWQQDERAAFRFARLVMSRPSMIRSSVGKLPWAVAEACWSDQSAGISRGSRWRGSLLVITAAPEATGRD